LEAEGVLSGAPPAANDAD
jgi:hypothetical protein